MTVTDQVKHTYSELDMKASREAALKNMFATSQAP